MYSVCRYNDYTNDPLSKCDCTPPYSAENGISARCDLNPANGTYPFGALGHRSHGATDMKVRAEKDKLRWFEIGRLVKNIVNIDSSCGN
jgi:Phospholipase B